MGLMRKAEKLEGSITQGRNRGGCITFKIRKRKVLLKLVTAVKSKIC